MVSPVINLLSSALRRSVKLSNLNRSSSGSPSPTLSLYNLESKSTKADMVSCSKVAEAQGNTTTYSAKEEGPHSSI